METIKIYFDGAAEPTNPGFESCAVVALAGEVKLYAKASIIDRHRKVSNNEAEYRSCIVALKLANRDFADKRVIVLGDSQLVVNQVNEFWGCRADHLRPFRDECVELLKKHKNIEISWIPRVENYLADELTKRVLQEAGIKCTIR